MSFEEAVREVESSAQGKKIATRGLYLFKIPLPDFATGRLSDAITMAVDPREYDRRRIRHHGFSPFTDHHDPQK